MATISTRQLGLRLFVCLETLLAGALGLFYGTMPTTLEVAFSAPYPILSALMAFCALFGLGDILINDLLNNRYNFWVGLRHRNDGYLILSCLYAAILLIAAKADQLTVFHIHPFLIACACTWVAVMDVRYRYFSKERYSDFSQHSHSA